MCIINKLYKGDSKKLKVALELRKEELDQRREDMFQYWWSWTKYSLLVVFATTVLGCFYAILGVQLLFSINFPDYYIEAHGADISILYPHYRCPTAYMGTFFRVSFLLLCGTYIHLSHFITP